MSSTIDGVDRLMARRALELIRSTLAWLEQDIAAIPQFSPAVSDSVSAMQMQARDMRTNVGIIQAELNEPTVQPQLGDLIKKIIFEKGDDDAEVEQ